MSMKNPNDTAVPHVIKILGRNVENVGFFFKLKLIWATQYNQKRTENF